MAISLRSKMSFRTDLLALWLLLIHMTTATAPKPTKDGFCFKYIIQGYDTCSLIAKKHSITEADIESFNKDTWAWLGCDRLYQGDFICLSAGKPPMPMALPQATCGPQVPGTVRPAKWADLAGMNPCPSSKCCAFWGQCGVSELYCQNYRAPPAGPTATVKCATEAPKSLPSQSNGAKSKSDSKSKSNSKSKSDSKSKSTTKADTKVTTTRTKPTSTTKKKWTPEPTVSQYPWKAPWEMTMYSELGCEGDYYHLEGYNKKFLDDKGCLAIHGGLNSKFTETGVTCKWWTDGSLTWKNCDAGTLKKPKSWVVKNGYCKVFSKADCDCSDNWSLFYLPEGCTNTTRKDHTPQWEALQCSIDGRKWP